MMSDSIERMNKIIDIMSNIVAMTPDRRAEMLARAQEIANYNKKHFFSDKFQKQIIDELYYNLQTGLEKLEDTNTSRLWFNRRREMARIPKLRKMLTSGGTYSKISQDGVQTDSANHRQNILKVVAKARQYYLRTLNKD
jgi:hypothetical protein